MSTFPLKIVTPDGLVFDGQAQRIIVRTTEGDVRLDFSGKLNGRGAYICPDPQCLQKARKSKSLERSLEVPIPEEVYERLAAEMEGSRG